ncbi:unnamed protein product [Rodentolepis nana]|uniref:Run domain Beclin-1 interacting and cysteine-rich containing protein n=1 Tax=Rodentolepis nana TaxID=102285 RepID=A0A0R3T207_RODNA|nr:unnamed protein product [Rodentolepis nana]
MVKVSVAANLCTTYLHLTLSSNQAARLKLIHRSDYDAGYAFQLDDQTVYIFLRIPDPYLNKALLWTISDNEHESMEPQNLFKDHKPDTLNVFQQLITIIQYFCDNFKVPFPTELAAFESSYYNCLVIFNHLIKVYVGRQKHTDCFQLWFELIADKIVPFCNFLTPPSAAELETRYLEIAENQLSKTETLLATRKAETENTTHIIYNSAYTDLYTSDEAEIKNFRVKVAGNGGGIVYPYPSTTSPVSESEGSNSPNDIKSPHSNLLTSSDEWESLENGTGKISSKASSLEVQTESPTELDSIGGTMSSSESKTLSPKSDLSFQSIGSDILFCDFEENEGSNYQSPPSSPSYKPFHPNETEEKLFVNTRTIRISDIDCNSSTGRIKIGVRTLPNFQPVHPTSNKFEIPEEIVYEGKSQRSYLHYGSPRVDKAVSNGKRTRRAILASTGSNESLTASPRQVKRIKAIQRKSISEAPPKWVEIRGLEAAAEEIKTRKNVVQMIHSKLMSLDHQVDAILKYLMEGVQFFGELDSISTVILRAYNNEKKIQEQLEANKT